jgi:putative ABC transport system permease protein
MSTDIRYAIRTFLRTPGFTITATLTLALGIGATTAIFSVVNAVLLEPLPYQDPDRLAVITRLSLPDYGDLRRSSESFEDTAVWATNLYNLRTGDESRQIRGGVISRNLMPLLGVTPVIGRQFSVEDDRQKTVILGHGLWQSLFGGDPSAIGRSVELSGTSYTIIGIAPAGFRFPASEFQLWTPIGLMETEARAQAQNRALRIFRSVGRLKPGVTLERARAEVATISTTLGSAHPTTNAEIVFPVESLAERLVGDVRTPLLVLLATVALLLMIACANVANLTLARTAAREREMAIRSALGAARSRLFGQLAVESLLLGSIGGALGLLVAVWAVDLLPAVLEARLPRAEGIRINGPVVWTAIAATLVTSLLFGVAPAAQARGHAAALKDAGRGIAGGARIRRLRSAIVVAEVGLAVMVVIGAGLLARSFTALTSRDLGFVPEGLISFNVQLIKLPDDPARARVSTLLMDRLSTLPGVDVVGAGTALPPATPQRGTRLAIEGRELTPGESSAIFIAATPDYFRATRTPVLQGRTFARTDTASGEPVVVINRALAETLFPGQDAVGRRMRILNPEHASDWRTIAGVVGNVKYTGLESDMLPTVYTPFEQTPFLWMYVMVRTAGDPTAVTRSIRSVVREVEPSLTAANIRPMTAVVSDTVSQRRFDMLLVSTFAVLALTLAAIGIYGVIAYSVSQRTHEIGLRMALGADRGRVIGLVLGGAFSRVGIGLALGAPLAVGAGYLLSAQLYGVSFWDPVALSVAAGALAFAAFVASVVPASRAAALAPMIALRTD